LFVLLLYLDFYAFDLFVTSGKNTIAIDVIDKDSSGGGIKLYGYFDLVPTDLNTNAEIQQVNSLNFVNPEKLKEINVLRKNKISLFNK